MNTQEPKQQLGLGIVLLILSQLLLILIFVGPMFIEVPRKEWKVQAICITIFLAYCLFIWGAVISLTYSGEIKGIQKADELNKQEERAKSKKQFNQLTPEFLKAFEDTFGIKEITSLQNYIVWLESNEGTIFIDKQIRARLDETNQSMELKLQLIVKYSKEIITN